MDLRELRGKIDAVDDKIADLYVERMSLVKEVAAEKEKSGAATENPLREKEIVNRVTAKMPSDVRLFGKQVYQTLFDTSKAYQCRFIEEASPAVEEIKRALSSQVGFPDSAVVACQGAVGAYSMIAAEKLFPLSDIMYFKDFGAVFQAVEKGLCEFGVLPIENSAAGSVNEVYDLMKKHKFHISRSIKLGVAHNFLANRGATLSGIKEVVSHSQAISQCSHFLSGKDYKITLFPNTALAAKYVSESGRTDVACISSRECAAIYGLNALASNVQDADNNYTRFIAITKDLRIYEGANKISVMVNLPHEAGSLNKLLDKFSTLGLNLTKIESRPVINTSFEFTFYFDFEASITSREVQNLIAELDRLSEQFVFLGSYEEK